ncbi:EamA family transporter [Candidatus Gracilibacteria bacterium]|nr:EamA family transporter [Candidatus Gracilibacteria bacterium]
MELWMIYAILGAIGTGCYGICQKIETEENLVHRDAFIFYPYIFGTFAVGITMYIFHIPLVFDIYLIIIGAMVSLLYVMILRFRYFCLDYMSSSSYFINYRVFISIGLLFIGTFFFDEIITLREYIGVGLGFIIFYLLVEKKTQSETVQDLKKGYFFLGASVILAILIWVFQKQVTLTVYDMWSFVLYNSLIGIIISMFMRSKDQPQNMMKIKNCKALYFILLTSLFFIPPYFFHLYPIYAGGDVAIVYKIISYSLIFPVLFSILYYKEAVTKKKLLAFVLTIVSIWLFV